MTGAAFWPWWLGAASLAVLTVGCRVVARRPLGVSGIVERFVNLREELEAERQRHAASAADAVAHRHERPQGRRPRRRASTDGPGAAGV